MGRGGGGLVEGRVKVTVGERGSSRQSQVAIDSFIMNGWRCNDLMTSAKVKVDAV